MFALINEIFLRQSFEMLSLKICLRFPVMLLSCVILDRALHSDAFTNWKLYNAYGNDIRIWGNPTPVVFSSVD